MKRWKHLNFEQRKTIISGIAHNYKLNDIADLIHFILLVYLKKLKEIEFLFI